MNKKGYFEPLEDYTKYQCGEYIEWEPLSPSLKYLKEKIPLKLSLGNSAEKTRKTITILKNFGIEIVDSLRKLIEEYPNPEKDKPVEIV